MKKIIACGLIFCSILIFGPPLFSQNETLFHYPLNNGDLWEYWEGPRFFIYEKHKVIGDTHLPNGHTYKIIEVKGNLQSRYLKFQRIENQCVFGVSRRFIPPNSIVNEEYLLYNLEVKVGDTWRYPPYGYQGFLADSGIVRINKIDSMNFGNHIWKRMILGSYIWPNFDVWFNEDVLLLDSIGVYQDSFEGGYLQLRGAIIRGKQYGIITSVKEDEPAPNLTEFALNLKSYPNPVKKDLHAQFELEHPDKIQISIFDLLGRKIYEFPSREYAMGIHRLFWHGKDEKTNRPFPKGISHF